MEIIRRLFPVASIFAEERGGGEEEGGSRFIISLLPRYTTPVLGRIPGKRGARWASLDLWNSENLLSRVNCVKRDEFIEQSGDSHCLQRLPLSGNGEREEERERSLPRNLYI